MDKSVAKGAGVVAGGGGDGGGGPAASYSAPRPVPAVGGGMMGELANAMARRNMGSGSPPPVPYSSPASAPAPGIRRSPPPSMPAPMPGRASLPGRTGFGSAPPIPGKVHLPHGIFYFGLPLQLQVEIFA